jgi:ABC-type glycerol-3-phosphate transport system permease component
MEMEFHEMPTLLVTRVIPSLSHLLPFYLVVSYLGLVDHVLSMIIANIYLTYPFAVLIMDAFFDAFPKELIDSAIVDGRSRTGALFRIVLPVGAPGIASSATTTFLCFRRHLLKGLVAGSVK